MAVNLEKINAADLVVNIVATPPVALTSLDYTRILGIVCEPKAGVTDDAKTVFTTEEAEDFIDNTELVAYALQNGFNSVLLILTPNLGDFKAKAMCVIPNLGYTAELVRGAFDGVIFYGKTEANDEAKALAAEDKTGVFLEATNPEKLAVQTLAKIIVPASVKPSVLLSAGEFDGFFETNGEALQAKADGFSYGLQDLDSIRSTRVWDVFCGKVQFIRILILTRLTRDVREYLLNRVANGNFYNNASIVNFEAGAIQLINNAYVSTGLIEEDFSFNIPRKSQQLATDIVQGALRSLKAEVITNGGINQIIGEVAEKQV